MDRGYEVRHREPIPDGTLPGAFIQVLGFGTNELPMAPGGDSKLRGTASPREDKIRIQNHPDTSEAEKKKKIRTLFSKDKREVMRFGKNN